jgi:hypothetical protein
MDVGVVVMRRSCGWERKGNEVEGISSMTNPLYLHRD